MTEILTHQENGVFTLTLHRLEKKNAFTSQMYGDMAKVLKDAEQDEAVRVLVIQGHETIFCAGNDIADFLQHSPEVGQDAPVLVFLRTIASFSKPLVAAVCGPAVGIGTTMLLHCDLVYAGDNALFSTPFVNLGLCAEGASSLLMPRFMGYQRAAEVLMMGDPFSAETALEMGLVNKILPPAQVHAYAAQQALRLAAKPQSSLVQTKRLMKKGSQQEVLEQILQEAMVFGRLLREPAAKEAFSAFMERRKPDFSTL